MQITARAIAATAVQALASCAAWGRTSNLHGNCMKRDYGTRGSPTAQVRQ